MTDKKVIMITPIIAYSLMAIILIVADYWNPQQVSHYLGLDLTISLCPAIISIIVVIGFQGNKQQNLREDAQ